VRITVCSSAPLKGRNWWTKPTREYSCVAGESFLQTRHADRPRVGDRRNHGSARGSPPRVEQNPGSIQFGGWVSCEPGASPPESTRGAQDGELVDTRCRRGLLVARTELGR
jgi:hypothetical protein